MSRFAGFLIIAVTFFAGYVAGSYHASRERDTRRPSTSPATSPEAAEKQGMEAPAAHDAPSPSASPKAAQQMTEDDRALAAFLHAAMSAMYASFAQNEKWATSAAQLPVSRPANVDLEITDVTNDGFRMTAVNHVRHRQCDLFTGDSTAMAFGYAFDQGKAACGKARQH